MKNHTIRRFRERDYAFNKIKNNSTYITDEDINYLLDEHTWDDITFKFYPTPTGFKSIIIDNNSESEIYPDDLNPVCFDYYIKEITELSKEKVQQSINKIKELLYA